VAAVGRDGGINLHSINAFHAIKGKESQQLKMWLKNKSHSQNNAQSKTKRYSFNVSFVRNKYEHKGAFNTQITGLESLKPKGE
jgi:hypothetical protein